MIFKPELSPQNFHYDVLYPLYSGQRSKVRKNRFMAKPFQTNIRWLIGGKATARQTKFILNILEGKLTFLDTSRHGLRTPDEAFVIKIPNFWAWADKLGR